METDNPQSRPIKPGTRGVCAICGRLIFYSYFSHWWIHTFNLSFNEWPTHEAIPKEPLTKGESC